MIRVFLLDDHEVVRRGVRELLESAGDIEVVGEAGTAAEALRRVVLVEPDVAVLDVRLPDGTGIEVCRDLRELLPDLRCVMLTSFNEDEALFDAMMAGASGYVLKEVRGADLVDGIRRVAAGESLLDPLITARLLERLRNPPQDALTVVADTAGIGDPRPPRRRVDQPPDGRADVPRGQDREELRVEPADQARHEPPHAGRGLRRPPRRTPRQPARALTPPAPVDPPEQTGSRVTPIRVCVPCWSPDPFRTVELRDPRAGGTPRHDHHHHRATGRHIEPTDATIDAEPAVVLHRRTIDAVLIGFGTVVTVVLLVAGGLLTWAHNFSSDYVTRELSSQHVSFPDAAALQAEGRGDLVQWAGHSVNTGDEAQAYASFIDGHLAKVADGATYADLGAPQTAAKAAVTAATAANQPQADDRRPPGAGHHDHRPAHDAVHR